MASRKKDRLGTEKRILEAVSTLVQKYGLEHVGINNIAAEAGVSKVLIYRYFDSLDGLIDTWLFEHSFWTNIPGELLPTEKDSLKELKEKATRLFVAQLEELLGSPLARKVLLWQLSSNEESAVRIREELEMRGTMITDLFSSYLTVHTRDIHALTALLLGGIYYLSLAQDTSELFNGVNLHDLEGTSRLVEAVKLLVENLFES